MNTPAARGGAGPAIADDAGAAQGAEDGGDGPAEPVVTGPGEPSSELLAGLAPAGVSVGEPRLVADPDYLRSILERVAAARSYPDAAAQRGLEGTVTVRFRLSSSGGPARALSARAGDGLELLAEAAEKAVRDSGALPRPRLEAELEWRAIVAVHRGTEAPLVRLLAGTGDAALDRHAVSVAAREVPTENGWRAVPVEGAARVRFFLDAAGHIVDPEVRVTRGEASWQGPITAALRARAPLRFAGPVVSLPVRFVLD